MSSKMKVIGTRNQSTAVVVCEVCGQVYDTPISYKYGAPETTTPNCTHETKALHPSKISSK